MGTLLNAYISPQWISLLNLLSLTFPFLMILNIILCLFWIVLWKKRAFFFIVCSLFLYQPSLRWINFHSQNTEIPDFRIVSFNNKGKKEAEDYLKHQEADIVFLQESGTTGASRPQLDFPYQTQLDYLLSIQSKYKILDQGILWQMDDHTGNMQFADVEVKGKRIRLINIYLEPYFFEKKKIMPGEDLDENEKKGKQVIRTLLKTFKTHAKQVDEIRAFISASPYPVIVCGDFNSVPNSYEYYKISKNLKDAFVESGRGSSTSFHDYKIPIRIDYVLNSRSLKSLSYKVDRSIKMSDHYPVIVDFKLKKE